MISADNTAPIDTINPTAARASRYDPKSLLLGVKRRQQNIRVFRQTISTEREAIKYQRYIISQIDKDHADVKILRLNIKKRRDNIRTFRQAISEEKAMIQKERAFATNLKQNK